MKEIRANAVVEIGMIAKTVVNILFLIFFKDSVTEKKSIVAGYLMETRKLRTSKSDEDCLLNKNRIEQILDDPIVPKTLGQRLEKLLLNIYKNTESFGHFHRIKFMPPAMAYATSEKELYHMTIELEKMGLAYSNSSDDWETCLVTLNHNGFERAEQLLSTNVDSKKVFVAMGFKPDLINAMENAIKPACADCGFDAYLISEKEHNKGITDEIIVAIKTSKFIITDFTYNNCGAYFEAGYAQGHGLEVIRCCKRKWLDDVDENGDSNKLHFDVRHYNFILWESENDLKMKLKNRIRAIIPGANMMDS